MGKSTVDTEAAVSELAVGLMALVRVLVDARIISLDDYNRMVDTMLAEIKKQQN